MRRDDRDDQDPIDDILDEIERVMSDMMGGDVSVERSADGGVPHEPHFSVYEEDERVRVVADIPGIAKDDVELKCDGQVLTVSASDEHHDYSDRIDLPAAVDEHSASATYNNGVLEVVFDRADPSADIDL